MAFFRRSFSKQAPRTAQTGTSYDTQGVNGEDSRAAASFIRATGPVQRMAMALTSSGGNGGVMLGLAVAPMTQTAPRVGQTLTGSYVYSDADGDPEGASTFRWLRNGSSAIAGATTRTYTPTAADVGATLTFEVTPVAQSGEPVGIPAASAPTAPISPVLTD